MRTSAVVVVGLCLVAAIGGLGFGAEPAVGQSSDVGSDVENASQTIEIELGEDGTADVSVSKQFALETAEDEAAFERLAEDFEDGEVEDVLSADTYERVAAGAEDETGREMSIEGVERETEATSNTGTLRLDFTWIGFAHATDERIEVGDAFVIGGETWLPELSDDQRLIIHAPEGYGVESAEASIDGRTLVWEGPRSFEPGEFEAEFARSEGGEEGVSQLTIGLGLGLVAAIVLLVYVLSRREGGEPLVPTPAGGDRGWATVLTPGKRSSGGSAPAGEPEPDHEAEPEPPTEPETDTDPDPFAGVDEDLLSDEERVLRLLAANDGRMKQASIVVETDWSNAKVSQLLSAMEEDGEIEKLRIGRENLITLADGE